MRTNKKKIILFDIDDTLIKSNAKIYVLNRDNKIIKKLTPAQYNHYIKKDDESFAYDDFDNEEILNKAKLTEFWKTLDKVYNSGYTVGIVTAREDKEMLLRFFSKRGIVFDRYLVFPIGGNNCKFKGKIKDRKRQVIEHLSAHGYTDFVLYDDNEDNLREVERMRDRIGVKIKTIKAICKN